jgi:hypothetical protein
LLEFAETVDFEEEKGNRDFLEMKNLKNQFSRKNKAVCGFIFSRKLIFQVFHREKIEISFFLREIGTVSANSSKLPRGDVATIKKLRLSSFKQV